MTDRPVYLKNSQLRVAQRAATIANEMARQQLLGDQAPDALAARLAVMRDRNISILQTGWSPFIADVTEGLSLRLRESDAMLLADLGLLSLTDDDLQLIAQEGEMMIAHVSKSIQVGELIQGIATDAMEQSILENDGNFIRSMLRDIFEEREDSYYASMIESPSIVSKVRESWRNR